MQKWHAFLYKVISPQLSLSKFENTWNNSLQGTENQEKETNS